MRESIRRVSWDDVGANHRATKIERENAKVLGNRVIELSKAYGAESKEKIDLMIGAFGFNDITEVYHLIRPFEAALAERIKEAYPTFNGKGEIITTETKKTSQSASEGVSVPTKKKVTKKPASKPKKKVEVNDENTQAQPVEEETKSKSKTRGRPPLEQPKEACEDVIAALEEIGGKVVKERRKRRKAYIFTLRAFLKNPDASEEMLIEDLVSTKKLQPWHFAAIMLSDELDAERYIELLITALKEHFHIGRQRVLVYKIHQLFQEMLSDEQLKWIADVLITGERREQMLLFNYCCPKLVEQYHKQYVSHMIFEYADGPLEHIEIDLKTALDDLQGFFRDYEKLMGKILEDIEEMH